ncbi:hypothetical protein [Vulcanisaeta souniana]|uniref:hypothetical protein n=1 Tax=Vulcanisaeta souniana TaxID=164452 RepID=UPI001FB54466|nr:hypothetical protein [Vulcanisaeta souniana]
MNWKLTVIGLGGFVIALLVAASVFGISTDAGIPGPVTIYYPTATLNGVTMYGWIYSTSTAPDQYAPRNSPEHWLNKCTSGSNH